MSPRTANVLFWLVLGASSPAVARTVLDDQAVRERAADVLRDPELQTKRPDGTAEVAPPPDVERPRARRPERDFSPPVQAPSGVSQVLIWIVLGAIVVAVVAMLVNQASRTMRKRKLTASGKQVLGPLDLETGADPERLDETLRRALSLAAEGRFEDAVHALLAGAIADLQQRAGLATEPAFTSRELLARVNVPDDPRVAFRELVVAVELSLFGGMTVTREDFDRCAASFRTLRQAVAT